MVGATKHRTQADDARIEAILAIGCIVCLIDGWPETPCEVHHLLIGGVRPDEEHRYTIGLDPWHHEGKVPENCNGSVEEATIRYGPSLRHNSKAFHERYGSDEELLALTDTIVEKFQSLLRRGEFLAMDGTAVLLARRTA